MTVPTITQSGCKNCRFSAAGNNGQRECRFGPPTANAVMAPNGKGGVGVMAVVSVWPQMQPDMKCGQYQRGLAFDERGVRVVA